VVSQTSCGIPRAIAAGHRPSWKLNSRDEQANRTLPIEGRTDAHAVGFGGAVPPSEMKQQERRPADPGAPRKGACRIRFRRSDARLHTDTAKLALPSPPDTALRKGAATMKADEIEAMRRAITEYARPVTRCSPGKARAKPLRRKKVLDDATRWLRQHRRDVSMPKPFVDQNMDAERGLRRKARAERKRIRRAANAGARNRIRE